jgi:hypothetical protein
MAPFHAYVHGDSHNVVMLAGWSCLCLSMIMFIHQVDVNGSAHLRTANNFSGENVGRTTQ